ncbi:MAG: hypothetical protein HY909_29690 [Deltaproteobacteria bacterium]|nr:hypothetical protein [Deltaproteobacteria bacterium]
MNAVRLDGLDGGSAPGVLASLGVLDVLTTMERPAKLAWERHGRWRPVLHGVQDVDAIANAVLKDAKALTASQALPTAYPKIEEKGPRMHRGLEPPRAVWRASLRSALGEAVNLALWAGLCAEAPAALLDPKRRPTVAQCEPLKVSDDAALLDAKASPTFFDFTARREAFLDQVASLRASLDAEGIKEALTVGGPSPKPGKTLRWDDAAEAPGAIFPVKETRLHPVREWLVFRALALLPVLPGCRAQTTGCRGERKNGRFVWPLWSAPIDRRTVRSLLGYPALEKLDSAERTRMGLVAVFSAELTKGADGKGGVFAPTTPC